MNTPPIYSDECAGHIAGPGRTQKDEDVGDFLGLAQSPEGYPLTCLDQQFLSRASGLIRALLDQRHTPVGAKAARGDDVEADSGGAIFFRQCLKEARDPQPGNGG